MTLLTPPSSTRVTPEDLLRMHDNSTLELVDGQTVQKNVSAESSEIELLFSVLIKIHLMRHPVAKVYPASLGYRCFPDDPDKVRRPDTSVIRLDRLKALADQNPGLMPIVPDLAIEVISPDDIAYEVDLKVQEYQNAGFPLIWMAHPTTRVIAVYPLTGKPSILTADDEISAEPLLPGFRCKVADFFSVLMA